MLGPCWHHVGTFFSIRRLFFVPGWFLTASCTFWLVLVVFFGPAGLDFLFFGSTLKRGGTCAAHPPPPEGRAERARPKSFHPSVPSSNLYASKLSLRFLATGPTPILIFPFPGPAQTAALRPQFAFEASKCDFFAFQKSSYFLLSFFLEKIAKIQDFGLPKPSQNPSSMPSKSMSHKTCIFSAIVCLFWLFSALCAFSSKCLKPSKNCGFVALRAYQHCVFVGT